jgi:UPF0716 protein FxsA
MSLVKWGFIGLLALPAAEIAVFILVALAIGWLWTIALFLATSVIGIIVLKRSGRADLDRFRSALTRDGAGAIHFEAPGLAAMIGGILLVFPGFITDVAGALLFLPPVRRWVRATIGRASRKPQPTQRGRSVIDLAPDQWRQLPNTKIDDDHERKRRP